MKENITQQSDSELSLLVFNTEGLYNMRFNSQFIGLLNDLFEYTDDQLTELIQDLKDDAIENEIDLPLWLEQF